MFVVDPVTVGNLWIQWTKGNWKGS